MGSKTEQVKGLAKEAAGILTGHDDLEAQGRAERRKGEAKENIDHAVDEVKEVIDQVRNKVDYATHSADHQLDRK